MFRKLILSTVAVAALSAPAFAADLPVRAPAPAPIYSAPIFTWSGFYVGLNAGASWQNTRWTNVGAVGPVSDRGPGDAFSSKNSGFIGGAHAGYNWQIGGLVIGLEGTLQGTTAKSSTLSTFGVGDDLYKTRFGAIGTAAARVGYAFDRTLLYVKGGYAGAEVKTSITDVIGPSVGAGSHSDWRSGYVLGAGLEYAFTRNWIAGVEYNYIDLGSKTRSVVMNGGADIIDDRIRARMQSVTARLTYKFGGYDTPVVAKY